MKKVILLAAAVIMFAMSIPDARPEPPAAAQTIPLPSANLSMREMALAIRAVVAKADSQERTISLLEARIRVLESKKNP